MRGGAETHLAELLPVLQARGHDVRIFVAGARGPLAEQLARDGIVIEPANAIAVAQSLPAFIRRFARLALFLPNFLGFVWRHRQSTFHIFLPETVIVCGMILWPLRRRFLVSQRSMLNYRAKYPAIVMRMERFVFGNARMVLANSQAVRQELLDDGVAAEKIHIIYNGLSNARLSPIGAGRDTSRAELGLENGALVFAVVANLFVYKGYSDLIKALGMIRSQLPPEWVLICIGRDVEEARDASPGRLMSNQKRFEREAVAAGIAGHVRFLGERVDAPELLRAVDIAVLPSHEEGFSNALIEKMAAGLPIVATTVGGAYEALDGGKAGLLVPANDPAALSEALLKLVENPMLCGELGLIARARALELYSIETCADAYERIYVAYIRGATGRLFGT